jgi:hypothetical protein
MTPFGHHRRQYQNEQQAPTTSGSSRGRKRSAAGPYPWLYFPAAVFLSS